ATIYYNPAGITQLKGDNLRGGVYGIDLDASYSPPDSGQTCHSSDHLAAVPQFFYTHTPKELPLSCGLGVYAPYGGNMNWPQDTGFNTVAISGSLKYISINPAVAVKLSPTLSIGGGVMVNYAKIRMSQGLRAGPANHFNFDGNGWSVGYNAGILWQPRPKISFGAAFRSAATVNMKGKTDFEMQPFVAAGSRNAHVDFTFPLTAAAGFSFRPTPKWNLEFDADYTDWSSFGTTTIYQQSNPGLGGLQNPLVNLDWRGSWTYEFGVTRYFDSGWHVSAGYAFNENSVPDTYYEPLAADMGRHFFSVGTGFKGKTFDFDIACQFGYGPAHTVTGSTPPSTPGLFSGQSADGKYGFTSSALILSVGMRF
ncbi:MAG: outer membrane protein transport protein, partial [Verrucomicrobiota bacterium]